MNCDNIVCDYDLFSAIQQNSENLFITCINQDIKDIRIRMQQTAFIDYLSMQKEKTLAGSINAGSTMSPMQKSVTGNMYSETIYEKGFVEQQSEFNSPLRKAKVAITNFTPVVQQMQLSGIQNLEKKAPGKLGVNSLSISRDENNKEVKRIKCDDFTNDVDFKYGIPMIILDIIYSLTGVNFVQQFEKEKDASKLIERCNTDSENFQNIKSHIPEEFHEPIFHIFNELGVLNFS